MKKIILGIITGIILVNLICLLSAELIIQPENINLDLKVSEQKTFTLNLTNTFTFPIERISFSNLSDFSFGSINLSTNETKIINFSVLTSSSYSKSINSKVVFSYIVDLPTQITTYQVNITSNGFNPSQITIRQGDTINWNNVDDITHTVTSSFFNIDLPVGSQGSYTFNQLGNISYQDTVMFYGGDVSVINRTSPNYVHNSNYDKTVIFNINSVSNPTNLATSILDNDQTVTATGSIEGILIINNTGSEKAERISLSSNPSWIRYDENNFDIDVGNKKIVKYHIEPYITESNQTDRNYTINLIAKASNSNESTISLRIIIPFSNVFNNLSSDQGLLAQFMRYCQQFPNATLCTGRIDSNNSNPTIIYRDSQVTINDSASEWNAFKKRVAQLQTASERTSNTLTETSGSTDGRLSKIEEMTNSSLSKQLENERKSNTRWNVLSIIILFSVIGICTWKTVDILRKKRKEDKLLGGLGTKV